MEFLRERELIHLRYELRRLLADSNRAEARPLLERLREIAAESAAADGVASDRPLRPEIDRWASTFGL